MNVVGLMICINQNLDLRNIDKGDKEMAHKSHHHEKAEHHMEKAEHYKEKAAHHKEKAKHHKHKAKMEGKKEHHHKGKK